MKGKRDFLIFSSSFAVATSKHFEFRPKREQRIQNVVIQLVLSVSCVYFKFFMCHYTIINFRLQTL